MRHVKGQRALVAAALRCWLRPANRLAYAEDFVVYQTARHVAFRYETELYLLIYTIIVSFCLSLFNGLFTAIRLAKKEQQW